MNKKEFSRSFTVLFFSVILLTSTVAISIHPAYSQTVPETGVLIMNPEKDAFLKDGNGNVNEGANSILQLKGNARPVIAFNQTQMEQTISDRPIINATLRLFIADIGGNLGSGQQTNLHKLNEIWEEGNAAKSGGSIPGSGSGVTWKCPIDSDISDNGPDCSIQWGGGNFNATVSDSITLTNSLGGQFVEFNLTGDVQSILNSNSTDFGWLMKKQNNEGAGTVSFTSKEGTANNPELIIHYDRPEAVLANEYMDLIDQLNTVGLVINSTTVTQSFINNTKADLDRIEEIVIELQNLGFDGNATSQIISGSAVGTVSFFDDQTLEPLFDKQIPNGTLAVFTSFGIIDEFEGTTGELSFDDQVVLINGSLELVEEIISSGDDDSSNALVLGAIGAYHPSTGNTFVLAPLLGFANLTVSIAIMICLQSQTCAKALVDFVRDQVVNLLNFLYPTVFVMGHKFHDKNNDGFHDLPEEEPLEGFIFTIASASSSLLPFGASGTNDTSDLNGNFTFQFKTANKQQNLTISEDPLSGWIPNINGTNGFIDVPFNPDEGLALGPIKFGNVKIPANGTVASETKISSTSGNFTGVLDNTDLFGYSVSNLGDLDGDGVSDLGVGAAHDDDGGQNSGAVWILFLNSNGTVKSHQKISNSAGNFTGNLLSFSEFGTAISNIGDFDGDGVTDIAVGARLIDDGFNANGAVWILLLNSNGTVKSPQKISSTSGNFTGVLSTASLFGSSVSSIGDLDGDSVTDIIVGSPGDNDNGIVGDLWVLFLNSNGTVKSHQKISDTAGNFTGNLHDGDAFGIAISNIGDLDNNGVTDIAVGSIGDADGGSQHGAVWILFLNSNGTVKSHQKISDIEGNFNGVLLDNDRFGNSLTNMGDIDGNGITDLIVGAFGDNDGGGNRGAVWTLFLE